MSEKLRYQGQDARGRDGTGQTETETAVHLTQRLYDEGWQWADVFDSVDHNVGMLAKSGRRRLWWAEG
jgi:hypothetical protein